jgi:hypothetical protein
MKNLLLRSTIFFIFVIVFISCNGINRKNRAVVSERYGATVDFIDTLKYYCLEKGWIERPAQYGLKITTYINTGCSQCIYDLISWKKIISEFELQNAEISFLFYLKTSDVNSIKSVLEYIEFPYPVIIDHSGIFYTKNKIGNDKMYQTYLVDANNKILLVGNPLYSDKIKELYFSTIKKIQ